MALNTGLLGSSGQDQLVSFKCLPLNVDDNVTERLVGKELLEVINNASTLRRNRRQIWKRVTQ